MLVAALLPLLLFLFPLWSITLTAPQYPNGISLFIWINQITGDTPSTLQNINILNHYVGMKYIVPDSIPELKYFPYITIGIVVLGLVAFISKTPRVYLAWAILFAILGALGIYDFYLWEYDYGHNLSETAPIKIPGQAYQPPLFGSKMLLNFKADSYPALGGISMGISMMLGFLAFYLGKKNNP
jgi:copper chaperone NosL